MVYKINNKRGGHHLGDFAALHKMYLWNSNAAPASSQRKVQKHKAKIKNEGRNKDVEMGRAGGTAALLSQALPPSQLLPRLVPQGSVSAGIWE